MCREIEHDRFGGYPDMGRGIQCAVGTSTALGLEVHRQNSHAAGRIRWRMTTAHH